MITVRDKKVSTRQDELVQIAVVHEHLPLKHQNWAERWCTLPKMTADCYKKILNFQLRNDDVLLLGFTKSGTTWLQEAVWLLIHNLDFESASKDVMERTKVLEEFAIQTPMKVNSLKELEKMPSPRFIKSHLSASLLPIEVWKKKHKIIYVARNPKDVCVSGYLFYRGLGYWTDDMDSYVKAFVSDEINYEPYWSHIVEYWKLRHESYVFFVTYEEMKRDLSSVIKRLCVFLERPQLTEEEMKNTLEHLSFVQMKNNKGSDINEFLKNKASIKIEKDFQFMRSGIVGSYKDELTEENQKILNEWTQTSLAKFGLKEEDIFGKVY